MLTVGTETPTASDGEEENIRFSNRDDEERVDPFVKPKLMYDADTNTLNQHSSFIYHTDNTKINIIAMIICQ